MYLHELLLGETGYKYITITTFPYTENSIWLFLYFPLRTNMFWQGRDEKTSCYSGRLLLLNVQKFDIVKYKSTYVEAIKRCRFLFLFIFVSHATKFPLLRSNFHFIISFWKLESTQPQFKETFFRCLHCSSLLSHLTVNLFFNTLIINYKFKKHHFQIIGTLLSMTHFFKFFW